MIEDKKLLSEFFGILSGDGFIGCYNGKFLMEIAGNNKTDYEYFEKFVIPLVKIIFDKEPKFYYHQGAIRIRLYSKSKISTINK